MWGGVLLLTVLAGGLVYASLTTTAETHLKRGLNYLEAGEKDQAIIEFRAGLKKDPKRIDLHERLGTAYLESNEYPLALGQFKRLVEEDPDNAYGHRKLAQLYLMFRDLAKAEEWMELAEKLGPNHHELLVLKAEYAVAKNGDFSRAKKLLETALKNDPGNVNAMLKLGTVHSKTGTLGEAEKWYTKAEKTAPADVTVKVTLGAWYLSQERFGEATKVLQEAADLEPDDYRPHLGLAQLYQAQKSGEDTLRALRHAVSLEPNLNDLSYRLVAELLKQRKLEEGRKAVDRIFEGTPGDPIAYFLRGKLLMAQGQVQDALSDLQQMAAKLPDFVEGRTVLGMAYELDGKREMAIREYEIVLKKAPKASGAKKRLARLKAQTGSTNDAIQIAQGADRAGFRRCQLPSIFRVHAIERK